MRQAAVPTFIAVSLLTFLVACAPGEKCEATAVDPTSAVVAPLSPMCKPCVCNDSTGGDSTSSTGACDGFKHLDADSCVDCEGKPTLCLDLKCFAAGGQEFPCCFDEESGNTVTCPH